MRKAHSGMQLIVDGLNRYQEDAFHCVREDTHTKRYFHVIYRIDVTYRRKHMPR